jgi:hypothetical protein
MLPPLGTSNNTQKYLLLPLAAVAAGLALLAADLAAAAGLGHP